MNVVLVVCHPLDTSFTAAIAGRLVDSLAGCGHEVRVHDLYSDGFDPHITTPELAGEATVDPLVVRYADEMAWCSAVVFVYPTWWSSQPAMLAGWLDRVLAGQRRYPNVRRIVAVTTHGSSKAVNMVQGEGGKLVLQRTVRARCSWRCRVRWVALYGIDRATAADRARHVGRAERAMRRL